jgi:hypothetical protein
MTDQHTLSSFPSRPFSMTEIDALEARDRIHSIVVDDFSVDDGDSAAADIQVAVSSCVLITPSRVTAAAYVDDDEAWHRAYRAPRPGVDLTEAYETIRASRGEDTLFAAAPLSPREAIYHTELDNKLMADDPDYARGDAFDCPLCVTTHTVRRRDDEAETHLVANTRLYVDCPAAAAGTLPVY